MKLSALKLKNFRSYKTKTTVYFDNLTTIIGKNDVGKSTILEALEIFFNNDVVSIEQDDLCINASDDEISISCVFTELPEHLTIDSSAETTLSAEYLSFIDEDGIEKMEVIKKYDASKKNCKNETFIKSEHYPIKQNYNDLHGLTITKLKSRAKELKVDLENVDKRKSSELRKEIWTHGELSDEDFGESFISTDKDKYGKEIWSSLQRFLPVYALFQSDRSSRDQDDEVQDPIKIAIKTALKKYQKDLERLAENVTTEVKEVAKRTSKKMTNFMPEWDEDSFNPNLSNNLNIASKFKYEILGGNDIPINKRGSGVRRLILLAFFQAEAEKSLKEQSATDIIYAIEEPETSQHPDHQLMLMETFEQLALQSNTQIIITTHVPSLANKVEVECIRYVKDDKGLPQVKGGEEVLEEVVETLGVLPNPIDKVQVIMYVEGKNDIPFFEHMSKILHESDEIFPNINNDERIAIIPTGGSTLKDWVDEQYLKGLNKPEFHIYDSDVNDYQTHIDEVNQRNDDSIGIVLKRNEMENYIPAHLLESTYERYNINIGQVLPKEDIVDRVCKEVFLAQGKEENNWEKNKKNYHRRFKKKVSEEIIPHMKYQDLIDMNTLEEVESWFNRLNKLLN